MYCLITNKAFKSTLSFSFQKFLMKYQYLQLPADRATVANIRKGIKDFQKFFDLPATGFLDTATRNLMRQPRCGNRDVVRGTSEDIMCDSSFLRCYPGDHQYYKVNHINAPPPSI